MSGIFTFWRANKKTSASIAKDRLQVLVAHERSANQQPEWMPKMQREILDVIRKYVPIASDDLKMEVRNEGENVSVIEINVDYPIGK
ncbi:cell division topological specificity factor MinE [Nitrincola tibetensis]|uniref:Cell division topological specificity factor n=1 Tax=Nitrincola tibetensis TaxID=2219697 RepID=A0A364NR94_9GAMM|nr:cell division topological specificity factor MinE [Nitrincola tibetensis]RAU19552.1 cell division topological specificity factor MinE [Nitrincola tibetensis]